MERLHKFLAQAGIASRRAAEQLITSGRVSVNGETVTRLGVQVDPERDRVEVDGVLVQPSGQKLYLVLNKPAGVVTTTRDPWGRPTVMDLVPKVGRLYPVGRLDAETEGLLLLTNDGELANRVMHPRYGCDKEYRALVRGVPSEEALEELRSGVQLDDGVARAVRVEVAERAPGGRQWLRLTLREGRKREVRRMLAAVGLPVEYLQRVRIGPLKLGELPVGKARPLSRSEVAALYAATEAGS